MYNPSLINKNHTLPVTGASQCPTHGRFQQIHPAFQGTNNRYSNQPQPYHIIPPRQEEFNASATSPMFYGYTSTPFSKL